MDESDGGKPDYQPTVLQRRLIDAAADISEAECDSPEFMHSVLCQVGLPRRATKARFFERSNGRCSIAIEAGKLWDKRTGFADQPLPYGAKPRLVLLHLCSAAIKNRSPEVEVGRSANEFLGRLGLDNSGHEYPRFRAQMEALASCRMYLAMEKETPTAIQRVQINTNPISRFEAWMQRDQHSLGLWPGLMVLSGEFYSTLIEHAVPLDLRAISGLQKSALALDVYTWLAHRLCRVRKADGVKLSWANLRQQFGQEYTCSKDFKKEFKAALVKVYAVYPDARMSEEAGGLRLFSSPPPVPKSQGVVKLPSREA